MYMNCAPITVTGSEGSTSALSALPDMFVANIGNGCSVSEGTDVQFPNPGDSVARENGATNVFAAPQGACATGSSQPGPDKPTAAPTTAAPTAAPTQPASEDPVSVPGGVLVPIESATVAPAEPTKVTPPAEPTKVTTPPAEPTKVTPPAEPTKPVTPPVSGGQSGPCTTEGAWNCVGGNSFQRCASGAWTPLQPVALGTSCVEGVSDSFKFGAKGAFMRRAFPVRV
jgi:hypothetical protein